MRLSMPFATWQLWQTRHCQAVGSVNRSGNLSFYLAIDLCHWQCQLASCQSSWQQAACHSSALGRQ